MTGSSLKIYTDEEYLPEDAAPFPLVRPFWNKRMVPDERFLKYETAAHEFITRTSLEKADVVVLPFGWERTDIDLRAMQLATALADKASRARKPIVVFYWSDSTEEVPLTGSIVFRTSLYASTRKENEFAMPAWSEDFIGRLMGDDISLLPKLHKPSVGFCGFAGYRLTSGSGPLRTPKKLIRRLKHGWHRRTIRESALMHLMQTERVQSDFLVQDRFWTGLDEQKTEAGRLQARERFIRNIVTNDYTLCSRGGGNFSYRLYETLSCGRIPLFVNTDCVLPLEQQIDWKSHSVWIEQDEIANIASRLIEFHEQISNSDFIELQRACRLLWEKKLSPLGFFSELARQLKNHQL